MQTHPFRRQARGLALLAAAAGLTLYASRHPKTATPDTSQTAINHIIDAAEPLCRTLLPEKNVLHFAAHPSPTFSRNGSARNLWTVECSDNAGREIVHVLWDEDNRRCVSISQPQSDSPRASLARLNREAALVAARSWITRLNIAGAAQAANAPGELRSLDDSFRVFLRLPDGLATVWLDAHSGEVFNVMVRGYPDTSTMQAAAPPKQAEIPHS